MNVQNLISTINSLYPIDSGYSDTNEIGEQLLLQAIRQIGWRTLPVEILDEYARLCINENYQCEKRIMNEIDKLKPK